MARSQITVTDITRSGTAPIAQTTADATNKHYFVTSDERVYLEIVSSDAGSQTVSIEPNPSLTADGLTVSSLVITIAAGATALCGPFRATTFKQDSSYSVYVGPSVSTTRKFRAWRLPAPSWMAIQGVSIACAERPLEDPRLLALARAR